MDVEPDEHFFPPSRPSPWSGMAELAAWLEDYRTRLQNVTGAPVRFTWSLRMDPQIEVAYGSAEWAAHRFRNVFEASLAQGDALGIHPHMGRWDGDRWVVDYANPEWVARCVRTSVEAFTRAFDVPPQHLRFGARWWSGEALAAAAGLGLRIDLTAEPGETGVPAPVGPNIEWRGSFPSFRAIPQAPYRFHPLDPASPDPQGGMWEIPLLSGHLPAPPGAARVRRALRHPVRACRRVARRLAALPRAHRSGRPEDRPLRALSLWMWSGQPDPFWDAVQRRLTQLPWPYAAFAVRTDGPGTPYPSRVRRLLEGLLAHPLARRLRFVTPSECIGLYQAFTAERRGTAAADHLHMP